MKPPVVEVDVRGLEPPRPMQIILEELDRLPKGGELRARTDRRPVFLLEMLTAQGHKHKSMEQPDGSNITIIQIINN